MKEAFGGLEFGLTEMCFPSPGLEHKIKVIFEAALLHYIGHFFGKHFRIKTSGKKRRLDLSEIIFKLKKKTNEIYIYKYKLGRENVK